MSKLKWVFAPKPEVVRSLITDYIDAHIPVGDDDDERLEIIRRIRLWNDVYPRLGLLRLYELRTRTKIDPNRGLIKSVEDTKKVQESLPWCSENVSHPTAKIMEYHLVSFPEVAYQLINDWATKHLGSWGMATLKEDITAPLIRTIREIHGPSSNRSSMWWSMSNLAVGLGVDLNKYADAPLGPVTPSGEPMYPILVSHEYAEARDLG